MAEEEQVDWGPGDGLKLIGSFAFWIGLLIAVISWFIPVAVDTPTGPYGLVHQQVVNVGMLQNQMIVLLCGLTAVLVGSILYATGKITEAIGARRRP